MKHLVIQYTATVKLRNTDNTTQTHIHAHTHRHMLSDLKAEMDTLASTYRTILSHRAFVTFRIITAIIINQYLLCVHGMLATVLSVLHT